MKTSNLVLILLVLVFGLTGYFWTGGFSSDEMSEVGAKNFCDVAQHLLENPNAGWADVQYAMTENVQWPEEWPDHSQQYELGMSLVERHPLALMYFSHNFPGWRDFKRVRDTILKEKSYWWVYLFNASPVDFQNGGLSLEDYRVLVLGTRHDILINIPREVWEKLLLDDAVAQEIVRARDNYWAWEWYVGLGVETEKICEWGWSEELPEGDPSRVALENECASL